MVIRLRCTSSYAHRLLDTWNNLAEMHQPQTNIKPPQYRAMSQWNLRPPSCGHMVELPHTTRSQSCCESQNDMKFTIVTSWIIMVFPSLPDPVIESLGWFSLSSSSTLPFDVCCRFFAIIWANLVQKWSYDASAPVAIRDQIWILSR